MYEMTIDGRGAASDESFAVLNPATEEEIARAPDCSPAQLDAAVAAARRAFPGWSTTTIEARRAMLLALADRIGAEAASLAALLVAEQGKPRALADGEIAGAIGIIRALTTLDLPVRQVSDWSGKRIETRRVPIGVVAAIAPWNVPIVLAMAKLAPALLAGNTVVLKPSPYTPLTTLRMGALARDLLPPGVLNVVSGSDRLGPWLTAHPGVDKISFTGSTRTGISVAQAAAANLKRVTLELGGNDACIVLPDIDVAAVAERLFWMAFRNAGQVCVATKRLYVHRSIHREVLDALVAYGRTVVVGDGASEGTQIGPVNNRAHHRRVAELIADGRASGQRIALGDGRVPERGYFVPVTLVDDPPEDARIVREEQFGPVLPVMAFDTVDEVIERANASPYGLGGSVWSADEGAALAVAGRLRTGNVWINDVQHISPLAAFGGHKQSGIGVENGIEGLSDFTLAQTVVCPPVS